MLIADRYELGEVLGEGGMGSVLRALDTKTGRPVAVKLMRKHLLSDEASLRRFEREMHAMMLMEHPNTVRLYDFGRTAEGELYLVMELIEGRSLADELEAKGALAIERVIRIGQHIARALAAVHAKGIVHRDLKPQNIMLRDLHGEPDWVLVLDFGVATLQDAARVTQTGLIAGSPAYCSPEQALGGQPGPPGDLYMLGVVLYEMTTGRLPFEASTAHGFLYAHVNQAPQPVESVRADVPHWLSVLIHELLRKDPAMRPGDAALVLQRLTERGTAVPAAPPIATAMGGPPGLLPAAATEAALPAFSETDVIRGDGALVAVGGAKRRKAWLAVGALSVGAATVVAALIAISGGTGGGTDSSPPPPADTSGPVETVPPTVDTEVDVEVETSGPHADVPPDAPTDTGPDTLTPETLTTVAPPDTTIVDTPDTRSPAPPPSIYATAKPEGAEVSVGGQKWPTPKRLPCVKGQTLTLTFTKPQHLPKQISAICGKDKTVHVVLRQP